MYNNTLYNDFLKEICTYVNLFFSEMLDIIRSHAFVINLTILSTECNQLITAVTQNTLRAQLFITYINNPKSQDQSQALSSFFELLLECHQLGLFANLHR